MFWCFFFLCSRSDVCFCEAWDIKNWIFSCQPLSSTAVQSCSVKSFLFIVKECRERVSPPSKANKKGVRSSLLSASMPKLWMGIVFVNCQQLESRLPTFFLCVCVHPLPSVGETRDNDSLITEGTFLKAASPPARPPQGTGKYCLSHGAVYLFQLHPASRQFIILQKSSAGWRWESVSNSLLFVILWCHGLLSRPARLWCRLIGSDMRGRDSKGSHHPKKKKCAPGAAQ